MFDLKEYQRKAEVQAFQAQHVWFARFLLRKLLCVRRVRHGKVHGTAHQAASPWQAVHRAALLM